VKLATYYLHHDDMEAAREVYRDMANEQPSRLASIRDELLGIDSPYFWEVTDRGTNFDWLAPERKARLMEFFEWFGDQLPAPRSSVVPPPPSAPTAIPAAAGATAPVAPAPDRASAPRAPGLTSEEASAVVSDPGAPVASRSGQVAIAPAADDREKAS
jgi:hypothetical protein